MPLVSVIMNCRNSAKYLREALDSVYGQTFKDYEIIFWDNVSTDDSPEIALSYHEPLRYFRGESFLPLGAARNKAVEKAQGKYLALLDCDDLWLPEKLQRQVALFQSDPEIALAYSDCYFIDAAGNITGNFFAKFRPYSEGAFYNLFKTNFIPCPTAVFSKEAFDKVGGFRIELIDGEEYDLFLRIASKGRVSFISLPLAMYRRHAGNAYHPDWEKRTLEHIEILAYNISILPEIPIKKDRELRRVLLRLLAGSILTYLRIQKYISFRVLFKMLSEYRKVSKAISDRTMSR